MNLLFWKKKETKPEPVAKTREDYEKEGLAMPISDAVKAIAASMVAGEWSFSGHVGYAGGISCGFIFSHPSGLETSQFQNSNDFSDWPEYLWFIRPNQRLNWAESVLLQNAYNQWQQQKTMEESKKRDAAIRTLIEKYRA